jgi:hypothetical protein
MADPDSMPIDPWAYIAPVTPDLVLCRPNLVDLVRTAIRDATERGYEPDAVAESIGTALFELVMFRVNRYEQELVSIPARFAGDN